jgi:predicted phage terminase large subunit-like protein
MPYAREVEPGVLELRPNEGPQTEFLATPADIAIYGGAAGGGKSGGLLLAASAFVHVPGYDAIIFRRESTQLRGGGSLWEDSQEIYRLMGGTPVQTPELVWTFKLGKKRAAKIEFRHLQHEKDRFDHQGKQYAFIGFDELTHFTATQFWYLVSRMRSTCGVRPMLRATCNPDPTSFVRKLIAWWIDEEGYPIPARSGAIRWFARLGDDELEWADTKEELEAKLPGCEPLSLTFILSRITDNKPLLDADPGYIARLKNLNAVDRARLLGDKDKGGNWDKREAAGELFKRHWFGLVETPPLSIIARVRAWDLAGTKPHPGNTDPDWTRGSKLAKSKDGRWFLEHIEGLRDSPGSVEDAVERTALLDGKGTTIAFWEDPGQAGKSQAAHLVKKFANLGYKVRIVRTSKSKTEWAKVWSPMVEHGLFSIVRGPWNDSFINEAESFPVKPGEGHDDQIDAVSLAVQVLTGKGASTITSEPITVGYSL